MQVQKSAHYKSGPCTVYSTKMFNAHYTILNTKLHRKQYMSIKYTVSSTEIYSTVSIIPGVYNLQKCTMYRSVQCTEIYSTQYTVQMCTVHSELTPYVPKRHRS